MTTPGKQAHELLTGEGAVAEGPLGRAYQAQVRRVRELRVRLAETDPEWLREWERKEKGK